MVTGISVVIPNFNGVELFKYTLSTVFEALENVALPNEIIVADDFSTDKSIEFLQINYPSIIIVKAQKNCGFSATANMGILATKYDKILLLNSDVKLTPNYFDGQLHYFNNPKVFGVMGRIVGWDDDIIQDGAKYPSFHGVKIKTTGNYLLQETSNMDGGIYSMYLSGANMLFDKRIFLKIGKFDTIFSPFYTEDFELSLRAWRLGFLCIYNHNSICRHQVSITIKKSYRKKLVNAIYDRNKMFLHAIHLQGLKKYLWYLQLIPEALIRIITFRWHYLSSLYQFGTSQKKVTQSILNFKNTSKEIGTQKTVKEVADYIKESISDVNITRF
jgi:GT2 family glycosyltransferase